jgi:polyisoprenoid-binding protein YceI
MRTIFSRLLLAVVLVGLAVAPSLAATKTWQIDPAHAAAHFSVRHLMVSNVKGEFTRISGAVNWDDSDVSKSSVEAGIDTGTINTGNADRDKDLRSDRFLNVEKFSKMTFRSKSIKQSANGKLEMTGDLTIRGITHEVTFEVDGPTAPVKDPWGNLRAGVSATAKINRQSFDVKWNAAMDGGGVVVGDEVAITLDLELIRKP